MAKDIKRYSSKKVMVIVDGETLTGLGTSDITASLDNDFGTFVEGIQGDIIYNENNSRLGTITVPLLANSPSNAYLVRKAKKGDFVSIAVIDKLLGERVTGKNAAIVKFPDVNKGKEAGERQYTFKVAHYDMTIDE